MSFDLISEFYSQSPWAYSDNIQTGRRATVSHLYKSSHGGDFQKASTEILNIHVLGSTLNQAPVNGGVLLGRSLKQVEGSPDLYVLTLEYSDYRHSGVDLDENKYGEWHYQYSSSLGAKETNKNHQGHFITVGTVDGDEPTKSDDEDETITAVPKVVSIVKTMEPVLRVNAEAILNYDPVTKYVHAIGKLNSSMFTLGALTCDPKTVMLISANSNKIDNRGNFKASYQFEVRDEVYDWDAVVVAINPETMQAYSGIRSCKYSNGQVIGEDGPTLPRGCLGYQIYKTYDLNSLFNAV